MSEPRRPIALLWEIAHIHAVLEEAQQEHRAPCGDCTQTIMELVDMLRELYAKAGFIPTHDPRDPQ